MQGATLFIPFGEQSRSCTFHIHYADINDDTKELYFNRNNNRYNNILYGSALDGDKEYIENNGLEYRAWFNEKRGLYQDYTISYITSAGEMIIDNDNRWSDLDVIKIESDTLSHGGKQFVNSIEIHHPYSYNSCYLKLKMYAQYWTLREGKINTLVKIEEIGGIYKVKH